MTEVRDGTDPSYRPDIDGLRAIAVLTVVGFHAGLSAVPGGFIGVDVFFVISGYLISGILIRGLQRGTFSFWGFYSRRIRRIFPALIVVLGGCLTLGWFRLRPDDYQPLGKHVLAGTAFVSNFTFWLESGYFDTQAELKPLLHLWSLAIEEQFYLLWPLLLFLGARLGRVFMFWAIALVGLLSFGLNLYWIRHDPAGAFYLPHTRFWELLTGCGLAQISLSGPPWELRLPGGAASRAVKILSSSTLRATAAATGLLIILFAASGADTHLTRTHPYPGWRALLPTLGTALIVVAGPDAWVNRRILANRALVFIGLISYPLYLWHWPLLAFAKIAESDAAPSPGLTGGLIAIAFVLAWLTYQCVEVPIRKRGRVARSKWTPIMLAGMIATVGLFGWWVYADQGVAIRYPRQVRGLLTYRYDIVADWRAHVCYLNTEQLGETVFSEECAVPLFGDRIPGIALWGDSHAAHLYPGLHNLQGTYGFRIAELATASCAPLLDTVVPINPYCLEINRVVAQKLLRFRPDAVVLAANWRSYDFSTLTKTIQFLHHHNVKGVFVVGQLPWWSDSPKNRLFADWRKHGGSSVIARTYDGIDRGKQEAIDAALRHVTESQGATFISSYAAFCNPDGCLAKTNDNPLELAVFDHAHLTRAGSIYLWSQIWPQIEPDLMHGGKRHAERRLNSGTK